MTESIDRETPDDQPVVKVRDELGGDEPAREGHGDRMRNLPLRGEERPVDDGAPEQEGPVGG